MEACPNCQAVRINGILCHEDGCPTPQIGKTLECVWCGAKFKAPEDIKPASLRIMGRDRYFCSGECLESFH